MAVNRFKLALNNANIPPLSSLAQRAVVNAGLDAAPRTPRIFMGDDDSADYNMAQVIYAENVMPSAHGCRSVGFTPVLNGLAGVTDFDTIFPLRDADENAVYYSPGRGKNYVYDFGTSAWTSKTHAEIWSKTLAAGSNPAESRVTYAYVDGKTFVCFSRLQSTDSVDMSIMFWNSTTQKLEPSTTMITNLPFAVGEIDGIASSNGYLLIWSGLSIAWAFYNGAAFNYEIYENGNFTGSGNQIPEDLQGPINAILSMAGGFLAFSSRNCISANYHSQTIQSPWVFKEVADAGGLESYEQATVEGSLGKIIAYTSAGVQAVTLNSAEHAHPIVADFVTRREIETYAAENHQLVRTPLTTDLFLKVTAIGNRYVVFSYGFYQGIYSFALIYDIALQRWGKIRLRHRDAFAFNYSAGTDNQVAYSALFDVPYNLLANVAYDQLAIDNDIITPAPRALAFLDEDGSVQLAQWSARTTAVDPAVVILGKVQLTRNKNIQLNRVEVEGMSAGECFIQTTLNGRTSAYLWDTVTVEQTGDYRLFGTLVDCKNFNIVLEGTFDLSSIIVEAMQTGDY